MTAPALIPAPSHHQQLDVPELGMVLAADFDEEGIQIDVKEARGHTGAYTRRMAVALRAMITLSPGCSAISSAEAVVTEAISGRPTSR